MHDTWRLKGSPRMCGVSNEINGEVGQGKWNNPVKFKLYGMFIFDSHSHINPLKTKRRLFYLKTQFVPRSKHFSARL